MSEYDSQLKRMRDAFAASIVKSMTPEEINNTFQKLHDENVALKQRAEKAERERDELTLLITEVEGWMVNNLSKEQFSEMYWYGSKMERISEPLVKQFSIQQKIAGIQMVIDCREMDFTGGHIPTMKLMQDQLRAQLKDGE